MVNNQSCDLFCLILMIPPSWSRYPIYVGTFNLRINVGTITLRDIEKKFVQFCRLKKSGLTIDLDINNARVIHLCYRSIILLQVFKHKHKSSTLHNDWILYIQVYKSCIQPSFDNPFWVLLFHIINSILYFNIRLIYFDTWKKIAVLHFLE